ncbi:hypothetical protein WJX75_005496 [Coccomyxa subellipsoidea]|uniref:Cilium assembly protein DZIP1 N-terminal domain-containing protein n=1 Tax=Coccomyxa subellipsoidea TaxID=248742 RepID=A0ABR2YL00_9CHLO
MPTIPAFYGPAVSPAPAPFRFSAHQIRINWQILHGVDIDKLVRETDIDTLERCCAAMAYGDLQAEDPGSLSETNFLRLFRLAQLTVEYLLHIQDRLVWENGLLKAALMTERDSAEAKAAGGDSKQQEAELLWQVERLQRQSDELRQQELQSALEAATRREQAEADRRVLAAKEEALQVSQGSIDAQIAAASDEMRSLRQRLANSLTRQQELETRLKLSSILGESQTTIVAAAENKEELERLAKRLRSAEDDAARLRGVLRDQEQLRQQKAALKLDEKMEVSAEVEQLKVRLEAEQAERERLAQTKQDMEREAQAMRAQIRSLSRELSSQAPEQAPAADRGDPQAWEENSQLRQEVDGARKERTLMEAKVKRLQTMLVNQQPQQEELIKSIHFLEHDRGHITAARRSASAVPAAAAPREPNKAGELDLEGAPPQPSPEDTERFNAEMAHELAGAQRPGVRSRFPQPLPAFEHTRAQLEGEMEEELNKSLRSFGVDVASGRLSDMAYTAAAAQLEARRSKALAARPRSHRDRAAHLHSTILWHIHRVASKIRRKGQLRKDGTVGTPTLQTRASQRLNMDQGTWTGRQQQRASTDAARRARSSSPVRQGSSHWDRGYDSDDEGTARFGRTLSQSLGAPLTTTFGDAYSPLRSAIRPGSYTFKSAKDGVQAARDAWVPRLSSANAAARRLPTRLAKFGSAPGDFSRQRSVLAQYDLPLPHARTAGAAAFAPVLGADDAPPYYGPPARARTAGPSIAAEEELYFDSPARGGSGRFAAEPAGYMPPLRSGSMAAEYVYESQPQRTKTVESEKSFTQGYKAGLDAARAFAARAASGQFSAEADDDYFAEGAQQETGVSGGIKRAGGGPGVRTSVEDNGMAAEEALEEDMMDLDLQQEANVPEVELPSFQTLVQRQKSQQDMRYGAAYSPMGASSPALAQALASQTSENSAKTAAARTTSRLCNTSVRVPNISGGESAVGGSLAQPVVQFAPNPVYEGVRVARQHMGESGSGLRHEVSNGSARFPGTSRNEGLYDSARSVTAHHHEAHRAQLAKSLSTAAGVTYSQETSGPVRSVTAATFANATGPVNAWTAAPLKSVRDFYSTEHVSSVKIA